MPFFRGLFVLDSSAGAECGELQLRSAGVPYRSLARAVQERTKAEAKKRECNSKDDWDSAEFVGRVHVLHLAPAEEAHPA